ncbi:hypothetical protein KC614_03930 [candidate division WWE3 bacterium]|uniref:Transcription regulator TrmB N-terminal domain-containing protein n=1 Tax=candidate division WWE3 bacterium TaxID=2053526 RepID=A0A955LLB8_UNCKA|nr:hypothetical protein [candidate division WWE3 bacterium]
MKNELETLLDFGLTEKEAVVYLACLKEETSTPFTLAKKTKIPRTSIYDIISSLALKGLLTLKTSDGFTKQQTLIRANNPSVLREVIRQKHQKLNELELDIVNILPRLREDYHRGSTDSNFEYLAGIEGARETLIREEQAMTTTKTDVLIITQLLPMDIFGMQPLNTDVDVTLQAGVQKLKIIPLNDWSKHVLGYQYGRNASYVTQNQIRYVDELKFKIELRMTIIGEYIYKTCAEKDEVWGMIIKSKAYANTLRGMFHEVWKTATPVTEEFVQSLGENDMLKQERKTRT